MSGKPDFIRSKDSAWVPVAVRIVTRPDGNLGKELSSPTSFLQANNDLDFSALGTPVIVAFSLDQASGYTFPVNGCIEFQKAVGNPSSKPPKDIFRYIAVSNDGLLLVVVDDNPGKSGKWRYNLMVQAAGGAPVSIDPMIFNRR